MKICFFLPGLGPGGAEKVASLLSNQLVDWGYKVNIICFSNYGIFFNLKKEIEINFLGVPKKSDSILDALGNHFSKFLRFFKIVRKKSPDIIISFFPHQNILAIILGAILNKPIIISERSNPYKFVVSKIIDFFRRRVYSLATCLVIQTNGTKAFYKDFVQQIEIIPNPICLNNSLANDLLRKKFFVGVGRFTVEKGFDLLIEAFSKCSAKDWGLWLIGDGPEKKNLAEMVKKLKLDDRVRFWGIQNDVHKILSESGIFVMPSRNEGFPNALCEAMSFGMPVISFDCNFGPSEIINDNENGVLVEPDNVEKLAQAMGLLAESERERKRLGQNARSSMERFEISFISKQWLGLITSSLNNL